MMIYPESCYKLGNNTVLVNGRGFIRCITRVDAMYVAHECKRWAPKDKVQVLNIKSMKMVEVK